MIAAVKYLSPTAQVITSIVIMMLAFLAVWIGAKPLMRLVRRREDYYAAVLGGALLLDIKPRTVTVLSVIVMLFFGAFAYIVTSNAFAVLLGIVFGIWMPHVLISILRRKRRERLELHLVGGLQTLSSGVRAGLNLIQSMELIARDGPAAIRQEFSHLLREYEYGLSLEEAMKNSARRIGSSDYRLVFAALLTHRQRGGDLGQTLDRIAESIREIQRLESRVDALTAQGRATARALGAMPIIVLLVLYFIVDSQGVKEMFITPAGKMLLVLMFVLNIAGFLWIKKIMEVDI